MSVFKSVRVPKYRHHRPTGQALVEISGRRIYLGKFNSEESQERYRRVVAEWLAGGGNVAKPEPAASAGRSPLTITELAVRYWSHAERHYRHADGTPTGELESLRAALKILRATFGSTPGIEFGPLRLKALREAMITAGWSRDTINKHVGRVKRFFRWCASEELLPASVHQNLAAVMGLQRGRSKAKETEPVRPVGIDRVEATLAKLPEVVADMVRLQLLTGARPAEICNLRPCEVDRSRAVWCYVPSTHKNAYRGQERRIYIGPQAQKVLAKYLTRAADAFCFDPRESESQRNARRRAARQSPMTPSQLARKPKSRRRRAPTDHYDTAGYRRAIARACEVAFKMPSELRRPKLDHDQRRRAAAWRAANAWHPHQLRHTRATELRSRYGIEAAQTVLGHTELATSQIYAARDFAAAERVMAEIG